jgi:drug/metabolite transporter (DMT)-like permease
MLATLRVVTAGGCWALAAVIAKIGFDYGIAPVRMAEARVLVALILLVSILGSGARSLLRFPRGAAPVLVVFGLSTALVNGSYYVAISRLPVGVAISLQYTAPVLLLGLASASRRPRPGRSAWMAASFTFAGAFLVSEAFRGFRHVDAVGLLAASVSAVMFASYLLTAEAAGRRGIHPATTLLWGFVVAVAFWTVAAPWWSWPASKLAHPTVALAVLGVGVIGTLVPFFLAVSAVRVLSPATAAIAATSEPPFSALVAWAIRGEHLAPVQISGGALVVAGVVLAQRSQAVRPRAVPLEASA